MPWKRKPEDGLPRDVVKVQQVSDGISYLLRVRLAPPWGTRVIVIKVYDGGEVTCASLR